MPIIINSDTNLTYLDQHEPIRLNLVTREFDNFKDYIVSVAGDNNSQIITFQFPREYDGIDLYGTACFLTFSTSWFDDDDPPKHSSGIINLPIIPTTTIINGEETMVLQSDWVLTKAQTYRSGICKFGVTFYLPQDESLTVNKDTLETLIPVYDEGQIKIKEGNELKEYNYYSINSKASSFSIAPSVFSEEESYIAETVYGEFKNLENRIAELEAQIASLQSQAASISAPKSKWG